MAHQDDEFFSFTTPNQPHFGIHESIKMILVTCQRRPQGDRIVSILPITLTTVKMLSLGGARHVPAGQLDELTRANIPLFEDYKVRAVLDRMYKDVTENRPGPKLVQ